MARQLVNMEKLVEAQEAAGVAVEAAQIAADKVAVEAGLMVRQLVNLEKLAEAQEAADAAVETAQLAADRVAEAIALANPAPKLHGRRQPLALALPPDLLRAIDEFAVQDRRSRASLIEIILDDWVQAKRGKENAA